MQIGLGRGHDAILEARVKGIKARLSSCLFGNSARRQITDKSIIVIGKIQQKYIHKLLNLIYQMNSKQLMGFLSIFWRRRK